MTFFQSAWVPGANARNERYQNQTFHKGGPQMQPVEPGVLAGNYLNFIETMAAGIAESELPAIRAVGRMMSERAAAGRPVNLVVTSHLMSGVAAYGNLVYQFESDPVKLLARFEAYEPPKVVKWINAGTI